MAPRLLSLGFGLALTALTVLTVFTVVACAHGPDPSAAERQAVVAHNLAQLQDCWEELAADHPGASGSLLFAVDLRRNGTVEWVEIEVDELGVPKLSACAVRRIKRWRFPEDRRRRSIMFGVGFSAPP